MILVDSSTKITSLVVVECSLYDPDIGNVVYEVWCGKYEEFYVCNSFHSLRKNCQTDFNGILGNFKAYMWL